MRALTADRLLAAGLVAFALFDGRAAIAQEAGQTWQVGKATGEVWVVSSGVQNASLTSDTSLKFGDSIRTGRTGRVLLKRGEETIMIAPNSVVGILAETKPGSTTIVQQAGSILLEVNKRDARTFEVETPYLVAAVKGTQFRVTVGAKTSDVMVQHGSVEVSDSKTGKFALVLPGQSATVSALAGGGLSLHGQGALSPIQNGTPRATSVDRVPVPRSGLTAPSSLRAGLQARPLAAAAGPRAHATPSGLRIAAPIGQVRLDVHTATRGLAGEVTAPGTARRAATIWSSNGASPAASSGSFATVSPTVVTGAGAIVTPPGRANAPGDVIGMPTLGSTVAHLPGPAGGPARPAIPGPDISGPRGPAAGSAGPGSSGLPGAGLGTVGLGNGGITVGNGIVTVTIDGGGNGKGNNGNGNGNGGGNGSNAGGNGNGNGGQSNSGNGSPNSNSGNSNSGSNGNSNGNNGNAFGVGNGNGGGNGQGNSGNGNGNGGSNGKGR